MADSSRFCPICGGDTDEKVCPADRVPTVRHDLVAADHAEALVGQVFSERYEVKRIIGEGGFGRVYAARHLAMDRDVALKVLHPRLTTDRRHLGRFYREARTASRLATNHVVRVFDFGVDEGSGVPFLAMELLVGRTLGSLIGNGKHLRLQRAAAVLAQVATALVEAEQVGIVHRDLKPDNVFLVKTAAGGDLVKVVDFGIAKIVARDGTKGISLTGSGVAMGTPQYMAPEQILSEEVDARTDLYALGCILHEAMTGYPPFSAGSKGSLLTQHVQREAPRLRRVLPNGEEIPDELRALHGALLRKEPDARPSSAKLVLRVLEAVAQAKIGDTTAPRLHAFTPDTLVTPAYSPDAASPTMSESTVQDGDAPGAFDKTDDSPAEAAAGPLLSVPGQVPVPTSEETVAEARAKVAKPRAKHRLLLAAAAVLVLLLVGIVFATRTTRPPAPGARGALASGAMANDAGATTTALDAAAATPALAEPAAPAVPEQEDVEQPEEADATASAQEAPDATPTDDPDAAPSGAPTEDAASGRASTKALDSGIGRSPAKAAPKAAAEPPPPADKKLKLRRKKRPRPKPAPEVQLTLVTRPPGAKAFLVRGSRKTALCTTPCAHTLKTRSETLRIRYVLPGYEERIKSFKVKPGPNNPPTTRLFKLPGGQ